MRLFRAYLPHTAHPEEKRLLRAVVAVYVTLAQAAVNTGTSWLP